MAAKRNNLRKKISYNVNLPMEVRVPGYEYIEHYGSTFAYSYRQAVSFVISRGEKKAISEGHDMPSNFVNLVMGELDSNSGAGNYAVKTKDKRIFGIVQTSEDLERGKRLDNKDQRLMKIHDLAHVLAIEDRANLSNPKVRMDYIDRAKASLTGSY